MAAALVTASALIALGLGALALRRSFAGMLAALMTGSLGLILLAITLFTFAGRVSVMGQVVALVIVGGTVAAAVVLLALHLSGARARGSSEDLEPW